MGKGGEPFWRRASPPFPKPLSLIHICSACRQLVMGMSEADARRIIWCPVAEEEKDLAIILNLKKRIEMTPDVIRNDYSPENMPLWVRAVIMQSFAPQCKA